MNKYQDNYRAWNISLKDFPKSGSLQSQIQFFSRFGILAASIHNTQPWTFEISKNILRIFPNLELHLKQADPQKTAMYISLGCCLTNIEVIAAYYNFQTTIRYHIEQNEIVALIEFVNGYSNKSLAKLAPFIAKRYSNKLAYLSKAVPEKYLREIERVMAEDVNIKTLNSRSLIDDIARLHHNSEIELSKNKEFAKELSVWLKTNHTKEYDGMPGFVSGLNNVQSLIGKPMIANFPQMLKLLAKKDRQLLESSPAVGLIFSQGDSRENDINVGRVYQKVSLVITSLGLNCTPMYAMIWGKSSAQKLADIFTLKGQHPKFFFRIGFAKNKPYHTPRRSINNFFNEGSEKILADSMGIDYKIEQIKIGNYVINYLVAGSGIPLILLHGGNIGWGQWYPNIPELSKYFKVYAVDLVGGGRSSKKDFSILDFNEDLTEVIEKFILLKKLNKVNIIGSSVGGWIATKLAIKRSNLIKKLILVDAVGFNRSLRLQDKIIGIYPLAVFLSKTVLKPYRNNKNIERFIRSVFYDKNIPLNAGFIDYFYDTMESSHNLLFISRMSNSKAIKELNLKPELRQLQTKTLVLWGDNDKIIPFENCLDHIKLIPDVKVQVLKNAGHIPSIEKSKEFNHLVIDFLEHK